MWPRTSNNQNENKDKNVERQMQMFEIQMMQSVFSQMTTCCLNKCIPTKYSDGELTKGEAVCLDRCAAKFMESYMQTTKKLSSIHVPEAAAATANSAKS